MSAPARPLNLLILCTGNSARSILGEAIANRDGEARLRAWSAGSFPKGQVHPQALVLLAARGYSTDGLRSKSWDEFTTPDAPVFDAVITVCDNAAGETCPVWLCHPVRVHWGIPDPAAATGDDSAKAFEDAYRTLKGRIEKLARLPLETLDAAALEQAMDAIGHGDQGATA